MTRFMRALRIGLEFLPMIERAVRNARADGQGWAAVRNELADQIRVGNLDRALHMARGSSQLVHDYVEGG